MAEIKQPTYQRSSFRSRPAKAARTPVPSNQNIPRISAPVNHKIKMAQIALEGAVNIADAFQAAEMTATRLEVSEETARLNKHIGEQRQKVNRNLLTAQPRHLLPKSMEDNFITDGHKIGEDTITAYVASENISDMAKKLIQPTIDSANNSFNIDVQNAFTKELVDRSKIAIKMRRNTDLNNFQKYMTETTRYGVENPSALYAPNKNEVAEYTAKQYDAFLQIEIKNKNLNDKRAELMLHEFKEELAGTILNRHLAQNPTKALEQSTYMVGGVPVDTKRMATFIDSHVREKERKRIAEESGAYSVNMLSFATQQPTEVLNIYSNDTSENHRTMLSRIESGDLDEELISEEDKRLIVPNYEMLNDDNPLLTKELLERMVFTAYKGQKALEEERMRKKGSLFLARMKHGLHSPTLQYSQYYKNTHYNWEEGKGFLPKQSAIYEISRTYGLDPITVETAFIDAIATIKTNIKPGSGMIGGDTAFKDFQNQLIQYWNDKVFEDNGLEDAERALTERAKLKGTDRPEPYIQNPLDLSPGKEHYLQMNEVQQYTIDAMVHDLANLEIDYRNTNNMSLPAMIERSNYWNDRFRNKDGTYEIQGKVWNNIQKVRWNLRLKDLQERPIGTVGNDLGLLDKMLKYPEVELNSDEKGKIIKRLKSLKIWKPGTKVNKFLFIPNEYWKVQKTKHGTNESREIKLQKALEQAKMSLK